MHEEMIEFIKQNADGVSSSVLAETFLKIKNPGNVFAHSAVSGLLSKDNRCYLDSRGYWHVKSRATHTDLMENLPLTAVFILPDPLASDHSVAYISFWDVTPAPQLHASFWICDPKKLSSSEFRYLLTGSDSYTEQADDRALIQTIASELQSRIPLYYSSFEHNLLRTLCYANNISLNDDFIYCTDLALGAKTSLPQPFTLDILAKELFGNEYPESNVFKRGRLFSECILELLHSVKLQGIETREDFDKINLEPIHRFLSGKNFTFEQIYSLPETHGVFGFKDSDDKYLYIGKTGNLKRKITGFFRDIGKIPPRLKPLLMQSHSMTTHICGSELEALLYERRLLCKYNPPFNTATAPRELQNQQVDLKKCIIIQPHISDGQIMIFLVQQNRRVLIKAIDTTSGFDDKLHSVLNDYFFKSGETIEKTDPFENVIVQRWLQDNTDSLNVIPVTRLSNTANLLDSIKQNCGI